MQVDAGWVCAVGCTGEGACSAGGWQGQHQHLRFPSAGISAPAQGTGLAATGSSGERKGQVCRTPGKKSAGCFSFAVFQAQQLFQECIS